MKIQKTNILRFTAFMLFMCGYLPVHSQAVQDIMAKLNLYRQKYPEEIVYLHTDRNKYSEGEIIWFKAYIIEEIGNQTGQLSNTIYIALVDQNGTEVVNSTLNIKNGTANGNMVIPDLLTGGDYMLIAHTDWMRNTPVDRVFAREITIENNSKNKLYIDIKLNDTIYQPGSLVRASVEFTGSNHQPVSTSFGYNVTNDKSEIAYGKGKTDKTGKAFIEFQLPSKDTTDDLKLIVKAIYRKTTSGSQIVIPTPGNYLTVIFYPESGMLINSTNTKIAFRAFNIADRPVDFEGQIFDSENKPVQAIRSTYNGIGSFSLNPERGRFYYMKVTKPSGISKSFGLPIPRRSGINVSLTAKTEDSLLFKVTQVNKTTQVYHFIGQMKGKVYWLESRKIAENGDLSVPLEYFPTGVAEFAVFDSLKNLVAKRLVYVNENKKLHIEVMTDKPVYAQRENVQVTLKVTDENGKPVASDLSVSVANKESEQPFHDNNNLFTYSTLKSDLIGFIPTPPYYFSGENNAKESLDNLLTANTFSRFTWKTVLSIRENDAPFRLREKELAPEVLEDQLIHNDDDIFGMEASVYYAKLLTGSKLVPGKSINVQQENDPEEMLDKANSIPERGFSHENEQSVMDMIYRVKPYTLKDGKIIFASSGPNSFSKVQGSAIAIDGVHRGSDPSVLNSLSVYDIDHINVSTNPIDIQRYTGLNSMGIIEVFTKGASLMKKTESKEAPEVTEKEQITVFQAPDYEKQTTKIKAGTDLRKTIFWKPDIQTDHAGQATVSFFNGDNPSEVVITVEGRTGSGLTGSQTITYTVK